MYVIGDTHWFHDNIVRLCQRPANHDELMVERWNDVVGDRDLVLHVGDLVHWKQDRKRRFREDIAPKLNGVKLLIVGNHDKHDPGYYADCGFSIVEPHEMSINGVRYSFDHYPAQVEDDRWHVHGHIHNNGYGGVGKPFVGAQHRNLNVSVEAIDYTPVLLDSLV
jgi:calcineurin-like phosphoesterase family protein